MSHFSVSPYPSRPLKASDGCDEWSKLEYIFFSRSVRISSPRGPSNVESSEAFSHRTFILDSSDTFWPLENHRNIDYSNRADLSGRSFRLLAMISISRSPSNYRVVGNIIVSCIYFRLLGHISTARKPSKYRLLEESRPIGKII